MKFSKYIATVITAVVLLGGVTAFCIMVASGTVKLPFLKLSQYGSGTDTGEETSSEPQIPEIGDNISNIDNIDPSIKDSETGATDETHQSNSKPVQAYKDVISKIPSIESLDENGITKYTSYNTENSRLALFALPENSGAFMPVSTEESGINTQKTLFELYMGYIIYNSENGRAVLDYLGNVLYNDLAGFQPAYVRDDAGRPLFIQNDAYYILESGIMKLSDANPDSFPALRFDYPIGYANSSVNLYPYCEYVWADIPEDETGEVTETEAETEAETNTENTDEFTETSAELPETSYETLPPIIIDIPETDFQTEIAETYSFAPDDYPETDPSMQLPPSLLSVQKGKSGILQLMPLSTGVSDSTVIYGASFAANADRIILNHVQRSYAAEVSNESPVGEGVQITDDTISLWNEYEGESSGEDVASSEWTENEATLEIDTDENEQSLTDTETSDTDTESETTGTESETTGTESETTGTESETTDTESETTGTESETTDAESETTDTESETTDTEPETTYMEPETYVESEYTEPETAEPEDTEEDPHKNMVQMWLWGYKNQNGETIIEPQFKDAYCFSENGLAAVVDRITSALMFINRDGKTVINPYGNVLYPEDRSNRPVTDGYYAPELKDISSIGMYYYNHGLVMVRRCQYDYYDKESLSSDEKILIYSNGKEYDIPESYKLVSYSEGVLLLEKNGYYGLLSYTGKWIAQPVYTYAAPFVNGLAVIGFENGRKCMIDASGKLVLPFVFDYISNCSDGIILTYEAENGWQAMQIVSE